MVTDEERLATRASSTCSLTIGRAKSKLNDARGLHTVPMPTEPLLQGDRLYRRCTNNTPQKHCRHNTYQAFAHHSLCDLSGLASCTLCVSMCPSVARCHLELAGLISADRLLSLKSQNLENNAQRLKNRHTPQRTRNLHQYVFHRRLLPRLLMQTPTKKTRKPESSQCRDHVAVPLPRGSAVTMWHPRQKRQVMPRQQETSLWPSDVRIVFSVLSIIRTELVNSAEATHQKILALLS